MNGIAVDIVIIGRNEGDLVATAVSSSQQAAAEFALLGHPLPRVIYVDGRSTDNSLAVARQHGAETLVVEGKPNPALGRHTGFQVCTGKYVFFLDGDMEVHPGWLAAGVAYLEEHLELAGVAGYCDWEVYEGGHVRKIANHSGIRSHGQLITTDVGGGAIYRADVLRKVGDFDPTMVRGGEFELYLRILGGGYRSAYLAVPMSIHRDRKGSMGSSFLRQSLFSSNIFINGVVARKAPSHPLVRSMLWQRYWLYPYHVISLLLAGYSIVSALGGFAFGWTVAAGLLLQLLIAHWVYKSRNMMRAIVSMVTVNLYAPAFLIGYLSQWPSVGGYYAALRARGKEGARACSR